MKVLVTGGAGFIGSHVVDQLIWGKFEVFVIDNFSTGKRENVNHKARIHQCDITNLKKLESIFEEVKPEVVIHHAAQISIQQSLNFPNFDADVNVLGTLNILQNCIMHNVKKLIYASSAAVYGDPKYLPVDEEHPLNPQSPYGISKHTPEHYISVFNELYGLDYTILRYANVYGPRQDAEGEGGVVSIFINRLLQHKTIKIFGDGYQTRDFVYVEDVAEANLLAINNGTGEIINISTNLQTSVKDLFRTLCVINNTYTEPDYQLARLGDIKHSYLDNNKAQNKLRWQPKCTLFEGLDRTLSYYKMDRNVVSNLAK
ncbi:NAD-dependent epimerase/dehydratase family protein [Desulfosporosinus sp. OT]|uniref:NAD-dependent epimerase/dehydratase family protein n=1 Tax=Desulfosporosinus sp. OT TaxID=913865 RepID=UPI000223A93A|nr:NAD-dependent epimerase/dehydratase family protein [Desulfosporosinus sp. OT]EGW38476.1 NAD dependent epimerase/dehydratase family protein [Desulfosporosinus sp. OT]